MAIKRSSVLQQSGMPDFPLTNFTKLASISYLTGGQPMTQSADATGVGQQIQFYDGGNVSSDSNPFPLGLLIEPSIASSVNGASGASAAGSGFDNWNWARGGLYSVAHTPNNFYDIYDNELNLSQVTVNGAQQNASCPFVANLTYTIGDILYATTSAVGLGYLSNVATASGTASFGIVRAVTSAGLSSPVITIELRIAKV